MSSIRSITLQAVVACVAAVISTPSTPQTAPPPLPEPLASITERLSLALPWHVAMQEGVRRPLEELSRERCDQTAITNLAKALQTAGYRREAAKAHVRFSETCDGHVPSLRSAANILLDLSDYVGASDLASDLIKLEPFSDNGYYLRAIAYDRGGLPRKAIDDYVTAIVASTANGPVRQVAHASDR